MAKIPFPHITPNSSAWTIVGNTAVFISPLSGTIQTIDRGGDHWRATMTLRAKKSVERNRLQSFLARQNAQQHRVTVRDHSYTQQGSIGVAELMTNPDFLNGVTGWSVDANAELAAVTDGMRWTDITGAGDHIIYQSGGIAATVGKTYALVVDFLNGKWTTSGGRVRAGVGTSEKGTQYGFEQTDTDIESDRVKKAFVASQTTVHPTVFRNSSGRGTKWDLHTYSMARALMVDNGPNVLTKASELDHADWTKLNSSITPNQSNHPLLGVIADELVEDATASAQHRIEQTYTRTSAQEFWTVSFFLEANTNQRVRCTVDDGAGGGGAAFFDATLGSITAQGDIGAGDMTFATIEDWGAGVYRCRLTSELPASTTMRYRIALCDGASDTFTYTGDGSSSLYVSGNQAAQGMGIGRPIDTDTAGTTGTNQTGSKIYLKGLDNDVDGQLRAGDRIEIAGQLLTLTADLDGDGSGTGLARIAPKLRNAPADETAVILHRPRGVFLLRDNEHSWQSRAHRAGAISDFTIELLEDIT